MSVAAGALRTCRVAVTRRVIHEGGMFCRDRSCCRGTRHFRRPRWRTSSSRRFGGVTFGGDAQKQEAVPSERQRRFMGKVAGLGKSNSATHRTFFGEQRGTALIADSNVDVVHGQPGYRSWPRPPVRPYGRPAASGCCVRRLDSSGPLHQTSPANAFRTRTAARGPAQSSSPNRVGVRWRRALLPAALTDPSSDNDPRRGRSAASIFWRTTAGLKLQVLASRATLRGTRFTHSNVNRVLDHPSHKPASDVPIAVDRDDIETGTAGSRDFVQAR